jgi:predicted alpha/beta-fold hydrolase
LQTVWQTIARRNLRLATRRERLELSDGDFLDLDWVGDASSSPIVLVLHGLGGGIRSPYAQGILQTIAKHNWRGAFMHFRGCSGEPNRLLRSYHSGETADMRYVLTELRRREPHTPLAAVGYSLGGNALIKYLGESGARSLLGAAAAVSLPFELPKAVRRLNRGASRFYQWRLLRQLRAQHLNKCRRLALPISAEQLKQLRTFQQFDDCITAPIHGFRDAADYYQHASCRQYLPNITVPTLIVQSRDDPFTSIDALPAPQELPPPVQLELSARGGHVGFVGGKFPWRPVYWLEQRVMQHLQNYFSARDI